MDTPSTYIIVAQGHKDITYYYAFAIIDDKLMRVAALWSRDRPSAWTPDVKDFDWRNADEVIADPDDPEHVGYVSAIREILRQNLMMVPAAA